MKRTKKIPLSQSKGSSALITKFFKSSSSFEQAEQAQVQDQTVEETKNGSPSDSVNDVSLIQPDKQEGVIFPIKLKFQIVGKFLCQNGMADRYVNFKALHQLKLEREPKNTHDPRAVRLSCKQKEEHLLVQDITPGQKQQTESEQEIDEECNMQHFYIGYVPKEIAFHLSQIIDNSAIFDIENLSYSLLGKQCFLECDIVFTQQIISQLDIKEQVLIQSFPGMKAALIEATMGLQKLNLNTEYEATYDSFEKDFFQKIDQLYSYKEPDDPEETKQFAGSQQVQSEQLKYNRNFTLVLNTVKAYKHLFNEYETNIMNQYVNQLSSQAQCILARLMLRKRKWFTQSEHLNRYVSDQQQIDQQTKAIQELIEMGLLLPEMCLVDNIMDQLDTKVQYEHLCEYLDGFTIAKLKDISKLVNRVIKNVTIDANLDALEVALNPFMKLQHYLEQLIIDDNSRVHELQELNQKLAGKFSVMISEYVMANQLKFKSVISKREKIHKIMRVIQGLVNSNQQSVSLNQSFNIGQSNSNQANAQHNLMRFFTFKQEQDEEEDMGKKKISKKLDTSKTRAKLTEIIHGIRSISNGEITFKVNERVSNLFQRCVNLFYFYQGGDPFDQLSSHDYMHHKYETFRNFLTHTNPELTKKRYENVPESYRDILLPIFSDRSQYIEFDAFTQLLYSFQHVDELKIKKPSVMGAVSRKLGKYLLKQFSDVDKVSFKKEEVKCQILENLRVILDKAKNHERKSGVLGLLLEGEPLFLKKYRSGYRIAGVLKNCVDFLEKDRQYEVACLLLTHLLMSTDIKPEKRGDWWVRLCIDLKHLKMKKESLRVAEHALLESSWVKTGSKNALFRIKDQLAKFMEGQQSKQLARKKTKKNVADSDEEEEKKAVKALISEIPITQNSTMLTQLNSQIGDQINLDLTDQYQILKEEADPEYFKETYIKCKKALTYQYQTTIQASSMQEMDIMRPIYHNQYKNEFYDVENLALRFYSLHQGLNGMHCENSLGQTLFGLLFWNEIFYDKIPYVFQTPYQSAPLDFGSKDFYLQRKQMIDMRLETISKYSQTDLVNSISESYDLNKGKFNGFVSWDSIRLSKKRLCEISSIIGGKRLALVMSNYCKDYKYWNHGMPDLILWDAKTQRVKFSEVKSETDRLSEVQRAWIAFLSQSQIDVEVCLVNRVPIDQEVDPSIEVFTESLN